jgi:hypothetical protein
MYYTNEYLDKRISKLTEDLCSCFKDEDKIRKFIEKDLENGSNIILEFSAKLKEIAEKNKEIHLVYKKMKEKINILIEEGNVEINNLIEENND